MLKHLGQLGAAQPPAEHQMWRVQLNTRKSVRVQPGMQTTGAAAAPLTRCVSEGRAKDEVEGRTAGRTAWPGHLMGLAAAFPTDMVVSSTERRTSGGSQESAGAASTSLSRLAAL